MSNDHLKLAFERVGITLKLDQILPLKQVAPDLRRSVKYRQIEASIREIDIIEPLIIYPQKGKRGQYILLDGLIRYDVLCQLERTEVFCLIATEDESYTYNHKVNRLTPLQQHFMILKAIESGVSEERIAATLAVNPANIRARRDMLKGICPEAAQLLRDCRATVGTFRVMRKVKPMRQIEMAELMNAANNYGCTYTRCLLTATPPDMLVNPASPPKPNGLTAEEADRMKRELENLNHDFRQIEDTHGRNVLNLTLACTYIRKLLDNTKVLRYLTKHHSDILEEFESLANHSKSK